MDFLRQKSVFFLRKYFDVPHAIGVLGRTFVEPITPELSQRGRLLGAVAQWQLRLCFFYFKTLNLSQVFKDYISASLLFLVWRQ